MPRSDSLLLEIGTEELPASQVQSLAEQLKINLADALAQAEFNPVAADVFATPRRLAVCFKNVISHQPEQEIEKRGPALSAAFDANGNPTPAALGFARSCNVAMAELRTLESDKGAWLIYRGRQKGQALFEWLPEHLPPVIKKFSLPRAMRWGDGNILFLRPVRWIVTLFGTEIIPLELFGLMSDRLTYGHRQQAPGPFSIPHADDYETILSEQGKVMASFAKREQYIRDALASDHLKLLPHVVVPDEELITHVAALVEDPNMLVGRFNQEFLQLPAAVLRTVLKHHQKAFSVQDLNRNIQPTFITVANLHSRDPQQVIAGNQRVVHARLMDALFFYHKDREVSLGDRYKDLSGIELGEGMGTMLDKTKRFEFFVAHAIANQPKWNVDQNTVVMLDRDKAVQLAQLAKCDLLTSMVQEFPELQGIMGYYYAQDMGVAKEDAAALADYYRLGLSDESTLPMGSADSPYGVLLALADRCDHLYGYFSRDLIPTGEKDPYALRRAAISLFKILSVQNIHVPLWDWLALAQSAYNHPKQDSDTLLQQLFDFILERAKAFNLNARVVIPEVWQAVVSVMDPKQLVFNDLGSRLTALVKFTQEEAARALTAAHKRVKNILQDQTVNAVDPALCLETAERNLHAAVQIKKQLIEDLMYKKDYSAVLFALAELQPTVDAFFAEVMVMSEDLKVRTNRVALLGALRELFESMADFSYLYGVI